MVSENVRINGVGEHFIEYIVSDAIVGRYISVWICIGGCHTKKHRYNLAVCGYFGCRRYNAWENIDQQSILNEAKGRN